MAKEYTTKEEILKLGEIDPEFEALIKANPIPQTPWEDPPLMRANRDVLSKEKFALLLDKGTTVNIPMRDGYSSELRIHKPATPPSGPSPLVVLIYGGGFVVGDNSQLSTYAGALAALYGATVVNISYRLVPEHPFPAAQHDTWDSVLWIVEHAREIGADPTAGFVLGGVSAGGNLTAAISQQWVDSEMSPPMTGLWLSIPLIFGTLENVPAEYKDAFLAREQNADAAFINAHATHWVNKHQQPDMTSPLYSPANSTGPKKYTGLPRTYFQVCGQDPLRDDALIYERILRKAGVETRMDVYPGVPHGHFSFLPMLKSSRKCNLETIVNFGWLLGKTPAAEQDIAKVMAAPSAA